ncbi:PKD domain-containing protein [Microbacterium sp. NPDC058345]|uniref:PKD domain-containing protein n=1 Tax=Microbacterium sp. NPDC058345 TaxID=3346455 RepID=UPI003665BE92
MEPRPDPFTQCQDNWDLMMRCVDALNRAEAEETDDPAPALPPITITDLASFAPDASTLTAEPDNLGVAGLPANFVATADTHTQDGELFGYPISVRFTPASFTFHFGDGDSLTADSGGQTWEALDLPQFTPTDTSHTYADRGTYTARVDVAYTAEIDLGVGWFPITGQLTTTGPDQAIRIYEAHTALVAHTCTERPQAPGC